MTIKNTLAAHSGKQGTGGMSRRDFLVTSSRGLVLGFALPVLLRPGGSLAATATDRKSTRLNSSHT